MSRLSDLSYQVGRASRQDREDMMKREMLKNMLKMAAAKDPGVLERFGGGGMGRGGGGMTDQDIMDRYGDPDPMSKRGPRRGGGGKPAVRYEKGPGSRFHGEGYAYGGPGTDNKDAYGGRGSRFGKPMMAPTADAGPSQSEKAELRRASLGGPDPAQAAAEVPMSEREKMVLQHKLDMEREQSGVKGAYMKVALGQIATLDKAIDKLAESDDPEAANKMQKLINEKSKMIQTLGNKANREEQKQAAADSQVYKSGYDSFTTDPKKALEISPLAAIKEKRMKIEQMNKIKAEEDTGGGDTSNKGRDLGNVPDGVDPKAENEKAMEQARAESMRVAKESFGELVEPVKRKFEEASDAALEDRGFPTPADVAKSKEGRGKGVIAYAEKLGEGINKKYGVKSKQGDKLAKVGKDEPDGKIKGTIAVGKPKPGTIGRPETWKFDVAGDAAGADPYQGDRKSISQRKMQPMKNELLSIWESNASPEQKVANAKKVAAKWRGSMQDTLSDTNKADIYLDEFIYWLEQESGKGRRG